MYSLKYDLLNQPLELKKTHDFCVSGKPVLTVVLIHGIASNSATFSNALKYLEGTRSLKDIRFVTFDLLGAGKSYKNDRLEYNFKEQLDALHRSIEKLNLNTPLILVGHSMGTLITTRYADTHKKKVKKLILVSPPVYTEDDLDNPAFEVALKAFNDAVKVKVHGITKEKSYQNFMKNIVCNRKNYKVLSELKTPAMLIYGELDQIIAPRNIPKVVRENKKYLSAIKTVGRHGMSREKYNKIREILEEEINETI
ncbi:alpha/beta hydrolase [Candidatus Saccharibacteria bacterium]|nr:alpha/beta hydrolase [Candidatus Saccharibacteria bacterium]